MNELLKINYEAEQPTVSARDLHEALEISIRDSMIGSREWRNMDLKMGLISTYSKMRRFD